MTNETRKEKEMTLETIKERKEREAMPYEIAIEIRNALNEARKEYNRKGGDWDGDEVEVTICELVFEED